jgi:asparagine N-glycosylation enzyme membrane subunit Stt3
VRESRPIVLIAVTSGLLSVMLAVAVNVATGGTLPGPLSGVSWLAWPAVAVLAAIAVALAILQQAHAEARDEWRAAERMIGDTPLPDVPRRRESLQERLEGF